MISYWTIQLMHLCNQVIGISYDYIVFHGLNMDWKWVDLTRFVSLIYFSFWYLQFFYKRWRHSVYQKSNDFFLIIMLLVLLFHFSYKMVTFCELEKQKILLHHFVTINFCWFTDINFLCSSKLTFRSSLSQLPFLFVALL